MSRILLMSAVLAAGGLLQTAWAEAADENPKPRQTDRSFDTYDKNQDGKISMQEAHADDGLMRLFTGLDANKDGALSRVEFAAYDPAGASETRGASER